MKKFKLILLIFSTMILLTQMTTFALADPLGGSRTVSSNDVKAGSSFTVNLNFNANEFIEAPTFDENLPEDWDATVLNFDYFAFHKPSTNEFIWNKSMQNGDSVELAYKVVVPSDTNLQNYLLTGTASAYLISPHGLSDTQITVIRSCGDVDLNPNVNIGDVMFLAKHVAKIPGFDTLQEDGDVDQNAGLANIGDVMYLAKHVAKIPGFTELHCK